MCFGSPSFPTPPQPNYDAQAQSQIAILNEQARIAEQQRAAETTRQTQQREQDLQLFNTNLSGAADSARSRALQDITSRGLNPDDFTADIDQTLNSIRGQVPQLDKNPNSYFADQNIADVVLGKATSNKRTQYSNDVNKLFGNDYANQRVASTADDAIIDRIIGEQYNPALEQVQRAYERGTVNDQGYQTALNSLNNQKTTTNASLQQSGGGVLQALRDQLSGVTNEARTNAANYQLGTTFDPTGYQTRADTVFNEGINGLEGNLRNTIGGQQFFDIGSILNQGRTSQGTANNNKRALFDAFASNEKDNNKQRGLGTQGVF